MTERILERAQYLLLSRGIHHFTMDELSQQLGISKKTLYRFFSTKLSLLEQVCGKVVERLEGDLGSVATTGRSSLQTLLGYLNAITTYIKGINPLFFADLRKHFPDLWQQTNAQIVNSIGLRVQSVLEAGIIDGSFRGNLHPGLVVNLWQQHMQCDFEYATLLVNDFSKEEVFRQAKNMFLYGIISPAAVEELDEALQQQALKQSVANFNYSNY